MANELVPSAHYLAWNVGAEPLTWDAKVGGQFQPVANAPGELWFCLRRFQHTSLPVGSDPHAGNDQPRSAYDLFR